jgi:hypothetical protein
MGSKGFPAATSVPVARREGAIIAAMYRFKRQFDHRKPTLKRWQIVLNLSVQIVLIAVGVIGLGISIVSLARMMRTGDAYGIAGLEKIAVAACALLILTGALCARAWIRRLAKLSDSQVEFREASTPPISTRPSATL